MTNEQINIVITAGPMGADKKRTVVAMIGDQELLRDELRTDSQKPRQKFATQLSELTSQPSRCGEFAQQILTAADQADSQLEELQAAANSPIGGEQSQASKLVALASAVEFFHSANQVAFATIKVDSHHETHQLASTSFRGWLRHQYYVHFGGAPGSQSLKDAIGVLEGRALYDGPERPVFVRMAEHEGHFYIDLADAAWSVVKVGPEDWSVETDSPVKFDRKRGMQSLPIPTRGGALRELAGFINVSADDMPLVLAWLLASLRPRGPFPVLFVNGEQGTAKSTMTRVLRRLIDPNRADLRSEPRQVEDLLIAASNGRVMALDNLSYISPNLSNALCRLATGGGYGARQLYTDGEEFLIDVQRPVIANGIGELITRGDLLDRSISVTLLPIEDQNRRTEDEFWTEFASAHPRLLGALLDGVSMAMRAYPGVHLATMPRMADFARWAVAAEGSMDIPPGTFLSRYAHNRASVHELAIETSPVALALRSLMASTPLWEGTAANLDRLLVPANTGTRNRWPANPQQLSVQLRRLAPNLRAVGIEVEFGRGQQRLIRIRQVEQPRVARVAPDALGTRARNAAPEGHSLPNGPIRPVPTRSRA